MTRSENIFVILGIFLAFLNVLPHVSSSSLYNPDDPLWELDSLNFERIVYGKSNAWIIEFYNSWCGYCVRFAPKWKEFARDIENWKNVIEVGVVNCVEVDSVKLCREYNVAGYPTIKLFPTNLNGTDKGKLFEEERDLSLIRKQTIEFLQSQKNIPTQWPVLKEDESSTTREFWNNLPLNVNIVYLVIEPPESYVGREIILDLSGQKHLTVKRVLSTNIPLMAQLHEELNNSSLAFLKISRDGNKETLNLFQDFANGTLIRDLIFETLTGKVRVKAGGNDKDDKDKEDKTVKKGVYMADLENAVRYALRQEVGVHSDISGEAFTALKNFITVLRMFFPASPAIKGYLLKLNSWIDNRKGNMTGERFVSAMDRLTTKNEYLPEMHDFVGCKGSTSKYRGYPCSLWTLFHTLTVQAFNAYEQSSDATKLQPQDILHVIRDYVKYFFTCRECSLHFQGMSENLANEAKAPKDSILWLWQAHNKVNKRLAGDETEDPRHPKIQFPAKEACEKCRIETEDSEVEWDRNAVLRYLQYFYKKENIVPVKTADRRSSETGVKDLHDEDAQGDSGNMLFRHSDYSIILSFLSLFRYVADF